jgi:sugar phosphate isomerase/epimerase
MGGFGSVALSIGHLQLVPIQAAGQTLHVARFQVDYTSGLYPALLTIGHVGGLLYLVVYLYLARKLWVQGRTIVSKTGPNMTSLDDRIGVSTLCMPRIPIEEAIGRIREAGFRAIEVVPVKVEHDPNVGDWLGYFTPAKRREIRSLLRAFTTVTVHSSSLGVNICHPDPAQRRHAAERYDALLEFAVDVGAPTVTLHAGDASDPGLTDRYHVAYGRTAAAYAAGHGLVAGFEFFAPEVIAQIGGARNGRSHFGLLFDIGHAAQRMPPSREACSQGVLAWIERMLPVIVEFHVHGVWIDGRSMIDHQSFQRNTALDYARVMALLADKGYAGPLMLEIEFAADPETTIAGCQEAKSALLGM